MKSGVIIGLLIGSGLTLGIGGYFAYHHAEKMEAEKISGIVNKSSNMDQVQIDAFVAKLQGKLNLFELKKVRAYLETSPISNDSKVPEEIMELFTKAGILGK